MNNSLNSFFFLSSRPKHPQMQPTIFPNKKKIIEAEAMPSASPHLVEEIITNYTRKRTAEDLQRASQNSSGIMSSSN